MDDQKEEDSLPNLSNSDKSVEGNALDISEFKAHGLLGSRKSGRRPIHVLFLKRSNCLGTRIPKYLVNLDEIYLKRCLEVIQINASQVTPNGVTMYPVDMGFTWESSSPPQIVKSSSDMANFVIECPAVAGGGDIVISPVGRWIVGSVMKSNSMINILKSPLFRQLNDSDNDEKCIPSDLNGSSSGLSDNYEDRFDNTTRRSPTTVTSVSSEFATQFKFNSRGILQCMWNGGAPCFTFSVAGHDLYVANAWRVGLPDNKAFDCVYLVRLRPNGQKEYGNLDSLESDVVVGKMTVSTSVSLGSNNSRVQATEFVLFGVNENHVVETQTSIRADRKSRKSSKVIDVLKTRLMFRTCSLEKRQDRRRSLNLLESQLSPNLELAAVVVKDYLHDFNHHRKEGLAGWGLKFLKKDGGLQNPSSLRTSSSECYRPRTGYHSISMDIIVPAGLHGGPRTRNGGPSSLIERWRSGGQCDCGGWDVGCPLTVLGFKPKKEEGFLHFEAQCELKSYEIFTQGSKQGTPTLNLVNIRDGLYSVEYQSTLSDLQCFSIAMAIIHSQFPIQQA
ncbi:hypothetical protein Nepgr_030384 [Nepenthes gracilis]|uniref:Uncharacterized protein n=1 Tax=Nepenthes gracilis TaxID=150966 RepID=A0AAD3TG41_NEPGR|nr:hypothetical protein Nepgr_030384 [Nepenthes gracilis]